MLQNLEKLTLEDTVKIVEKLTDQEQKKLILIIENRLKEKRKQELLEAINESREAFIKGDVKTGTVADLMAELEEE